MPTYVLVTGGAGYIGSHTCKLLSRQGLTPVVLDNLIYGHEDAVRWGPLIVGDISDGKLLDDIFCKYRPEAVIHFAAYAYVGESVLDPAKYYHNNVAGTISLLEGMRRNQCNRIIFSSTCATYGIPLAMPIQENHPQNPINPYGRSKLMIEQILSDYASAYGLSYVVLRYFNAAGADIDGELGEDHTPETHLIPLTIYAVLGKVPEISIYGSDYQTPDGTAIRDYIHVSDLADAHFKALELQFKNESREAVNLGTGRQTSVKEIVSYTEKITSRNIPVRFCERRPGDPPILTAGTDRAKVLLHWEPKYSDIGTIIETAWYWHRDRG